MNARNVIDRPDLVFRLHVAFVMENVVLVYFYGWIGAAMSTATLVDVTPVFTYWSVTATSDFDAFLILSLVSSRSGFVHPL